MQQCTYCGKEVPENARFCGYCGRLVEITGIKEKDVEHENPTIASFSGFQLATEERPTLLMENGLQQRTNESERETLASQTAIIPAQQENIPTFMHPATPASFPAQNNLSARRQASQTPNNQPSSQRTSRTNPASYATEQWTYESAEDEEDEREKRRRAMLLGGIVLGEAAAGLTPQAGNAPLLQSTPQVGNAGFIQGTPQAAPAPAPLKPVRVQMQQAQHAHKQPFTPTPKAKPHQIAKLLTHQASRWIFIAAAAVVVISTAGIGAALATAPVLSSVGISGKNIIRVGNILHMHGKGFLAGGHITLKRDSEKSALPIEQVTHTKQQTVQAVINPTFLLTSFQESGTQAISITSSGSFDANVLIDTQWSSGQHTIHATEDLLSRTASMVITVINTPAALDVQPSSLVCGNLTQGVKAALSVNVSNGGGQVLDWSVTTGGSPWLLVQKQTGSILPASQPQVIQITCDTSTLKAGHYTTNLQITSDSGSKGVPVVLNVVAPPVKKVAQLAVNTSTVALGIIDAGSPSSQVLTISNIGTDVLNWHINLPANTGWFSVDTSSGSIQAGGNPQKVGLLVDTSGLADGSYTAQFTVETNGGAAQVNVQMEVRTPIQPTPVPTPTSTPKPRPTPSPTPRPTPTPVPTPTPITTPVPTPTPITTPTPTPTPASPAALCNFPQSVDLGTIPYGTSQSTTINLSNCGGTPLNWSLSDGRFSPQQGTIDPNKGATTVLTVTDPGTGPGNTCPPKSTATFTTNEPNGGGETITIAYCVGPAPAQPTPTPAPTTTPPPVIISSVKE